MVIYLPHPAHPKYLVGEDGTVIGPSGKRLSTFSDVRGYKRINVWIDGGWRQLGVHRMVCEVFHGPPPPNKPAVAHGDGDPGNNWATNLRWVSYKENEADKRLHGRSMLGSTHHQCKLTEEQVRSIRSSSEEGKKLAPLYGVSEATISSIRLRKTWKHLT